MFDENDLKDSYLTITVRRVDIRGRETVVRYVRLDDAEFSIPSKKGVYFGRRVSKAIYRQLMYYFSPVESLDVNPSPTIESRQQGTVPRFILSVLNLI